MAFIEIPALAAELLFLIIPIISVCIVVLINPWLKNKSDNRWRNYLSYLVRPLPIKRLNPENPDGMTKSELKQHLKEQLGVRLALVYIAIAVFIIASTLGVFYYLVSDVQLGATQGSTGLQLRYTSILIATPFNGGWYGALPWYYSYPAPHYTMDTLHEPWQWIFMTALFTDNPNFFDGRAQDVIIMNLITSAFFLLPLALKSVRRSFVPSLFFFMTGMLVMMRGVFGFTAIALGLEFGSAVLRTGAYTHSGSHPHGIGVLLFGVPFVIIMSVVFALLAIRLWRVHYPEDNESRKWFLLYVMISYWISIVVLIPF